MNTCIHCGHTGDDVLLKPVHIEGNQYPAVGPLCLDEYACWKRWDEANGWMDGCIVKRSGHFVEVMP